MCRGVVVGDLEILGCHYCAVVCRDVIYCVTLIFSSSHHFLVLTYPLLKLLTLHYTAATWPTVRDRAPEPAAPVGFRRPPRRWIKEEDDQLMALIGEQMQNGNTKISWTGVAERMEHRTSKQCRERYTNNLDPNVGRKGNWTPDEDVMIKDMQHRIGNKWTKIAAGELYLFHMMCMYPL